MADSDRCGVMRWHARLNVVEMVCSDRNYQVSFAIGGLARSEFGEEWLGTEPHGIF